ncbi:hypothetical protein C2W62_20875 [Candidatus Entotheonella serta]|nr:hypothetical protein C2W62_20875 [Candidatus Entotheonella serta]
MTCKQDKKFISAFQPLNEVEGNGEEAGREVPRPWRSYRLPKGLSNWVMDDLPNPTHDLSIGQKISRDQVSW